MAQSNQILEELISFAGFKSLQIYNAQNSPYIIDQGGQQDAPLKNRESKLGTPIYSNLIFNEYNPKNDFDAPLAGVNGWSDFVIDDCLIQINQSKKIITTEIQGRDGTVKEYIGLDDFQVQIIGRISGAYNVYEKELVNTLKTILDSGRPLAVSSWWLQNLGINYIVIKDYNIPQVEAQYSTQYFSINAMSDKIVEARITG